MVLSVIFQVSPRLKFLMLEKGLKDSLEGSMSDIMGKITLSLDGNEYTTLDRLNGVIEEAVQTSLPDSITRLLRITVESNPDGTIYVSLDPEKDIHDFASTSFH